MTDSKRFLVDVGLTDLPFPMRVASRTDPGGQPTVADISISARIMQPFEARWIDRFIAIVHRHRNGLGTASLRANISDYKAELNASAIRIVFRYPYFVEKSTPLSGEPSLVKHNCIFSARISAVNNEPVVRFGMEIPCITTYPGSAAGETGGLFGQSSLVVIEVSSGEDVYPEDLVDLVDRHALAPVYSFLPAEDQASLIRRIHEEKVSSVVLTDTLSKELARDHRFEWYSLETRNFGMLHEYGTTIGTEKSRWVPGS
jgi:GTP cyclohydrolase I